jgi:hypothetical protein
MRQGDTKALVTQLVILEAALACIQAECELALEVPEVSFSAICRVAAIARQSSPERKPSLAKASSVMVPVASAPAPAPAPARAPSEAPFAQISLR